MATVKRSVFIGQPEPSPLSLRVPERQETRLAVTYRDQVGQVMGVDLGARLELASRSAMTNLFYNMVATDIVNGKAQTTIPAGDLTDPNGYSLRLRGQLAGEPMLLAIGAVALQAQGLPGMGGLSGDIGGGGGAPGSGVGFIERIDLVLPRGTVPMLFTSVWGDEGATVPIDLTAMTLSASIFSFAGGPSIGAFIIIPGPSEHTVFLTLTIEQLNTLPDSSWWTLVGATGEGATTYCEGAVTIFGEVTP
jgi:hypothetical protein